MFAGLGARFITALRTMYDLPTGGYYSMDTFNEEMPQVRARDAG